MAKPRFHDAESEQRIEDVSPDPKELRFILSFPGTTATISYQRRGMESMAVAGELIAAVDGCSGSMLDRMNALLEEVPQGSSLRQLIPGLLKIEFVDVPLSAKGFPIANEEDAEDDNHWSETTSIISCKLEVVLLYTPSHEADENSNTPPGELSPMEEEEIQFREKASELITTLPGINDEVVLQSREREYDIRIQLETGRYKQWQSQTIAEESEGGSSSLSKQQQSAKELEDAARENHAETIMMLSSAKSKDEKRQIIENQRQKLYGILGKGFKQALANKDKLPQDNEAFRLNSFEALDPAEKRAASYALEHRSGGTRLNDLEISKLVNDEARLTAKFYSGSSSYGDNLAIELALYHQRNATPATGKEAEDCHRRAAMRTVGLTEEDLRQGKTFGRWTSGDQTEYIVQVMPEFSSTALTDLVIRVYDPQEGKVFYLSDQYKSYKRNTVLGEEARDNSYSPPPKKDLSVVMTRGKTDNVLDPESSLAEVMLRASAWTGIIDSSAYVLKGEERDELYIHRTQVVKPEVREAILMSDQSPESFELEKLQNQDNPPSYKMVSKIKVPGMKDISGNDLEVRIETDLRVRAVKNSKGEWVPPKRRKDGYWNLDTVKSSDATEIVVPDEGWTCLLETKTAGSNTLSVGPGQVSSAEAQLEDWASMAW